MSERLNLSRQKMEEKLKELFLLSSQGDQEAYGSFLTLTAALVKKYLIYLGGKYESRENVEDLVQEILISLHQKKHTFRSDNPILPWLYAIARYRFIDHYRSKKRLPRMEEISDDFKAEETSEPFLNLDEILVMLTPKQKEMVMLVKVEGASYSEAAVALGMSVSSVKVGIHRILKSVKDRIAR